MNLTVLGGGFDYEKGSQVPDYLINKFVEISKSIGVNKTVKIWDNTWGDIEYLRDEKEKEIGKMVFKSFEEDGKIYVKADDDRGYYKMRILNLRDKTVGIMHGHSNENGGTDEKGGQGNVGPLFPDRLQENDGPISLESFKNDLDIGCLSRSVCKYGGIIGGLNVKLRDLLKF